MLRCMFGRSETTAYHPPSTPVKSNFCLRNPVMCGSPWRDERVWRNHESGHVNDFLYSLHAKACIVYRQTISTPFKLIPYYRFPCVTVFFVFLDVDHARVTILTSFETVQPCHTYRLWSMLLKSDVKCQSVKCLEHTSSERKHHISA